jgi:hypothetical protein
VVLDTRKYGERKVRQSKQSNDNGDTDPHSLVNRDKEHPEADEEQQYGEVEERRSHLDHRTHFELHRTEVQEQTDAGLFAWLPLNLGLLDISACPLSQ